MNESHTAQECSATERRLLALMTAIGHGAIEQLEIRNGEPIFTERTRIVQERKFGSEARAPSPRPAGFEPKRQVIELLALFDEIRNGTIEVLEVKSGLPFRAAWASRSRG